MIDNCRRVSTCLNAVVAVGFSMIKKRRFLLHITLLSFVMSASSLGRPLPDSEPIGARVAALAGTGVSLTGNASAIYHNPASIVWQTLTGGAGLQSYPFRGFPNSWWVHFYNKNTEYNYPMALVLQGWNTPIDGQDRRSMMIGMPIAYGLSAMTPAAIHVKLVAEETASGKWKGALPTDFGFLARHPNGATLGIVMRNVSLNGVELDGFKERVDYGFAWETPLFTLAFASSAEKYEDFKIVRDRMKVGAELANEGGVALRGGYVNWNGEKWYTGGIGLRTPDKGMSFDYSIVYDLDRKGWAHYIQYVYFIT